MDIDYKIGSQYLTARISGDWVSHEATQAIDEIRLELEKASMPKLLMDLTSLSAPKSNITRFHSGVKIAEVLFDYKIAGFSQPEKINRLGETTATNRGANFKMFTSERDAINWLLKEV